MFVVRLNYSRVTNQKTVYVKFEHCTFERYSRFSLYLNINTERGASLPVRLSLNDDYFTVVYVNPKLGVDNRNLNVFLF